jgi:L-iditol 2-dehydrogenase
VCIPAVNAIRIETDLPFSCAALTEPIACILRALAKLESSGGRFTYDSEDEIDRIQTIVITGGGPAGQIFLQVLRAVLGFDGVIILSDPSPLKRSIAEKFGAIAMDIDPASIQETIREHSGGRLAELVIDACGVGEIWSHVPMWIRKQASVLMYGYGRRGASMEVLNALQWREPNLVTPAGASGGFDSDGRPSIYRRSLQMIERGTLDAEALITHRYNGLGCLQQILAHDMIQQEYLKGVLNPTATS